MKRSAHWLAAFGALLAACQGREITVFEVPAVAGSGSQGGTAGAGEPGVSGEGGSSGVANVSTGGSTMGGSPALAGGSGGVAGGLPFDKGGAPPLMMPPPCTSDDDCKGWICDKLGCDAPLGFCTPYPPFCDANPRPVCGCDGVTYWNDCIRVQARAGRASPEQCFDTASACEVGSDCNVPGAACGHLLPPNAMCGHAMGECWVLPSDCDPALDRKRWFECKPADGAMPQCVDTCTAIKTEHSFAELRRGATCN